MCASSFGCSFQYVNGHAGPALKLFSKWGFLAWRFWSIICEFQQKSLHHMNHVMYEHICLHEYVVWTVAWLSRLVHVAYFNMKHTIELGNYLGFPFYRSVSWCAVQRSAPLRCQETFCSRLLHVGCIYSAMFLCRRYLCGCVYKIIFSTCSASLWLTHGNDRICMSTLLRADFVLVWSKAVCQS